jgi:hypothetical protein
MLRTAIDKWLTCIDDIVAARVIKATRADRQTCRREIACVSVRARVAEIIDFNDVLRQRARRREHLLSERCLTLMEESLAVSRVAYWDAPIEERAVRATKIRQLEDLIVYTANLP